MVVSNISHISISIVLHITRRSRVGGVSGQAIDDSEEWHTHEINGDEGMLQVPGEGQVFYEIQQNEIQVVGEPADGEHQYNCL